jgi:outer membrane immunogenic protein
MLKKFLIAGAAGLSLTGAAAAADLPRRAAPPLLPPVPVFTWTGAYFGINAGYAFDAGRRDTMGFVQTAANPVALTPAGAFAPVAILGPAGASLTYNNRDRDGFSGGGQIGYNYQFGVGSGVVIGIEADAQYLDFGRRRNSNFTTNAGIINPNFVPVNGGLSTLDFFGTVRGRLGYAWDRTLVYGTGGFAYASGGDQLGGFTSFTGRRDDFKTGWVAGGGIEYALPTDSFLNFFRSSAVTIKVEGLYVNLDRNRTNLPLVGGLNTAAGLLPVFDTGTISRRNRSDEFAVVRAGLNYKFGTF